MLAKYLVDAGLLTIHELDAAQMLVRSSMARGASLAVGDALVELRILSPRVLMAVTFLYQLDQTGSPQTASMLEQYMLRSGALTAEELNQARSAQEQALARGRKLTLGAALVRTCDISRQLLDQRLAAAAPPAPPDTPDTPAPPDTPADVASPPLPATPGLVSPPTPADRPSPDPRSASTPKP
jgi:hypothetical protein